MVLKRLTCAEEAAAEADQQTEEEEEQDVDVLGGGGRVLVDPGQRSCRSTPECERCASGTTLCLALALSLSLALIHAHAPVLVISSYLHQQHRALKMHKLNLINEDV